MTNFPTFDEIKNFISANPKATICEIRNHFGQQGTEDIAIKKPGTKNKYYILAYNINSKFYEHLRDFMKQDYVKVELDALCCMISDGVFKSLKNNCEFYPVVLSIKP